MKKVKLNLDDLRVDSFDTSSAPHEFQGTVYGQAADTYGATFCAAVTCDTGEACGTGGATSSYICVSAGCTAGTCYDTCNCADQSAAGYASCGTTCNPPNTCEAGCIGPTTAEFAC